MGTTACNDRCVAVADTSRSLAAQDERENAIVRIEELAEVVATELGSRQLPPVIEGIDVRIAADSVGNAFLTSIGLTLAVLGHDVHTLVLTRMTRHLLTSASTSTARRVGPLNRTDMDVISR